jgi:predicted permease
LIAVVSLALGIGANTAIFTLVNAILLRRPAVSEPERLLEVYLRDKDFLYEPISYPDYADLKQRTTDVFASVIASQLTLVPRDLGDRIESLPAEVVNGDYFGGLGLKPFMGHLLGPDDDVSPGGHPVTVLSYEYWERGFGKDVGVVGKNMRLNGVRYTIVGVAPREYTGNLRGLAPSLYLPVMMLNQLQPSSSDQLQARDDHSIFLKVRLKSGATYARARATLATFVNDQRKRFPAEWSPTAEAVVVPFTDVLVNPLLDKVLVSAAGLLMVVVGLVLLVACANLASFLLAQVQDRQREIAIRLAIGASRGALVRQCLTETTVLALAGGAAGVALAHIFLAALLGADLPVPLPITLDLRPDASVLAFATVVSLMAGVLFGIAPAFAATRTSVIATIKNENIGGGAPRRVSLRNALVVGQLAVSLVLLAVAGLFLRSLQARQGIDPGFGHAQAVMITFGIPSDRATPERGRALVSELEQHIGELPEVQSVGLISNMHLNTLSTQSERVNVDGMQPPKGERGWLIDHAVADSAFFGASGVPIVQGRTFNATDLDGAPRVVIINQAMADRFWPGKDPLGQLFHSETTIVRVVGVAKTVKIRSIAEDARPFIYQPYAQRYTTFLTLVARMRGDAALALPRVLQAARDVNRDLAIFGTKTMARHLAVVLLPARLAAIVISAFAALALALAIIGVYGVVSYAVARRAREVGIRLSLGAEPHEIVAMLLGESSKLIGIGAAIGLALGFFTTQAIKGLLFGVGPLDVLTFGVVTTALVGVGMIAAYVPARGASRLNPNTLLRGE